MEAILNFFMRRKLIVYLLTFMLIFAGIGAFLSFKVYLVPKTNLPYLGITVSGGTLPPEEMEEKITDKIEKEIKGLPEIKEFTSTSSTGYVDIQIQANDGQGIEAKQKIESVVNRLRNDFPEQITYVDVIQYDFGDEELIAYALTGVDPHANLALANTKLKDRLEAIEGVKKVEVDEGSLSNQVTIIFQPERLAAYSISPQDVVDQLRDTNWKQALGTLSNDGYNTVVEVDNTLHNITELNQVPIETPQGTISLSQLAVVEDNRGTDNEKSVALYQGKPFIFLQVKRNADAEIIPTQRLVEQEVAAINAEANGMYQLDTVYETASFVQHAVSNLSRDVSIGGALAVIILLVFLRNWRVTLVIATTLPLSVLMTFIALKTFGYEIDMITLISLSLSVGLIVDAAIVVLESIYQFRERGEELTSAIIKGTREVFAPVIVSQITMVVVFLPMVLADFDEAMAPIFETIAFTVTAAITSSTIAAFFFVPIFSDRFLRKDKSVHLEEGHGPKQGLLIRLFNGLLHWCLRFRWLTILGAVLILASTAVLAPMVNGGFAMDPNENSIRARIELPKGTKIEESKQVIAQAEAKLAEYKEIKQTFIMGGKEELSLFITLVPKTERERGKKEVQELIQDTLATIPGTEKASAAGQSASDAPVAVAIKGKDLAVANQLTKDVEQLLLTIPGVTNPTNDFSEGTEKVSLRPKTDTLERLGIDQRSLVDQLGSFIGEEKVTEISTDGVDVEVYAQYPEDWMKHPEQLRTVMIKSADGTQVPLYDLVDITYTRTPLSLAHENGDRIITVSADLKGTDTTTVAAALQKKLKEMNVPTGFSVEIAGNLKQQGQNMTSGLLVIFGSMILIYFIMVGQFGKLSHPFIIMLTLPMAGFGVIAGFVITGREYSAMSIIGIVMLIGIVVSNAILLIDRINTLRSRGMELREAIIRGTQDRVRPVLMTKMTAILGMLPMALAYAEGSDFEAPLATAVISGLIFHTLVTLVLVPVLYSLFEGFFARFRAFRGRLRGKKKKQLDESSTEISIGKV
ncbi:efflux RND transporter permease subunit [Brevibacillus dissolubilis]|uniref:efflux RND transporter permease subunit n=1 Tax=Brevibacillus dissolubilis TaxID=1844116 RepID=UPI001115C1BF|nr:efflux RND transporter permease subunit [Brevibacillus dissolubilis]